MEEQHIEEVKSFEELNLCKPLIEACVALGWTAPTKLQADSIPHALEGKDIVVITQAGFGSGTTGAFALPIIEGFLGEKAPQPYFCCVLSPTTQFQSLATRLRHSEQRTAAVNLFKKGDCNILICTDVKGLDIAAVDMVINYHIPYNSQVYLSRVRRAARWSGAVISLVEKGEHNYRVMIQEFLGKRIRKRPAKKNDVMFYLHTVNEANKVPVKVPQQE
ncbi:hypothetical protein SOVF_133940 [Spinacia oleracea]|nr:hypothetical protein SOVF_133940 [Spinacia oleracea]